MYTGGPMFWADTVGLSEVAEKIKPYSSALEGDHWEIAPLIEHLVETNGSLSAHSN